MIMNFVIMLVNEMVIPMLSVNYHCLIDPIQYQPQER